MESKVKILHTQIDIGTEKPFRVIHISDNHLTLVNENDNEKKHALCQVRKKAFPLQRAVLETAKDISRKEGLPILCTGDLIDFVSDANLKAAEIFMKETNALFVTGNHEFSQYVGEAKEDAAYREQSLAKVEKAFGGDVRFVSRIINGVNFVGIDDGYFQFDGWQLHKLKDEVEKGYPVVLLLHVPLFEYELFKRVMYNGQPSETGTPVCNSAELVGVSELYMKDYAPRRKEMQLPTEETMKTVKYIENSSRIKAVLAGHWHFDHIAKTTSGIPQVITGCETVRVIEFV